MVDTILGPKNLGLSCTFFFNSSRKNMALTSTCVAPSFGCGSSRQTLLGRPPLS